MRFVPRSRASVFAFVVGLRHSLVLAAPAATGTTATGEISGRVVDGSGNPLSGALVLTTSPTTSQTVSTGADGEYTLPGFGFGHPVRSLRRRRRIGDRWN